MNEISIKVSYVRSDRFVAAARLRDTGTCSLDLAHRSGLVFLFIHHKVYQAPHAMNNKTRYLLISFIPSTRDDKVYLTY